MKDIGNLLRNRNPVERTRRLLPVRREGETLAQLLTRLDLAISKAFTEDVFTDEINTPLRNS